MYEIMRTDEEIDDVRNIAADCGFSILGTTMPGMTFEDGIEEALSWVMGEQDDPPLSAF
jgi:hypothetical protein